MASVAEDIAHILVTLRALEDRMKTLKAMLNPTKDRKPNPWILFTKRIDALMKENNTPFIKMAESKQFASSLKKQKAYAEWLDEEILSERTDWLAGTLNACPVCEENPKDNIAGHTECIVAFAKQEEPLKNPVGAWMCAAASLRSTTTEVTVVDAPRRRRGRPPALPAVETETSLPGGL
jgi:hypothetical protein